MANDVGKYSAHAVSDTDTAHAELRRLLHILRRRRAVVIGVTLLLAAAGAFLSSTAANTYTASAQILLKRPSTNVQRADAAQVDSTRALGNEVSFMRSGALRDVVTKKLGHEENITIAAKDSADLVTLTASSDNAENAAKTANTYASTYLDLRQISLANQMATLRKQIDAIDLRFSDATAKGEQPAPPELSRLVSNRQDLADALRNVELALAGVSDAPQLVTSATVPTAAHRKSLPTMVLTMGVLGLVLGIGAAAVLDFLDRRVLDEGDLEEIVGARSLSAVGGRWSRRDPQDAYRLLRFQLFNHGVRAHELVAIATTDIAGAAAGAAVAIADECALAGVDVLLVGADLRASKLGSLIGLSSHPGISAVLAGKTTLRDAVQQLSGYPHVSALLAGPSEPGIAAMGSRDAMALVESTRSLAEIVLLETPSIVSTTDALDLAAVADAVILVVTHKTRMSVVEGAVANLRIAGARIVAAVVVPKATGRASTQAARRMSMPPSAMVGASGSTRTSGASPRPARTPDIVSLATSGDMMHVRPTTNGSNSSSPRAKSYVKKSPAPTRNTTNGTSETRKSEVATDDSPPARN